ncbi:MAG: carbamoyltransferase [Verrucomicrobia bacterium]|nr:carbamoyltransferase [Verrucomicrobiota bacterium]
MSYILGISAYYHDSAACLLKDGDIVAAAQEERFSRKKNDEAFPSRAIDFCLRFGRIAQNDLDAVVFYDKPVTKFTRILESYLAVAPYALRTFPQVMPSWLSEKLNLRGTIREELPGLSKSCPILFTEHHQAHASSAFLASPFSDAAILTVDGVGEWATTTIGLGHANEIEMLKELRFPHSLGLLYSAFTAYCGFRINAGEYKLMGLAPYGEPKYVESIYDHLIDVKSDGSFWLNMSYFSFLHAFTMTNVRFDRLFGGSPRKPDEPLTARHMDVARSVQVVTEEIMLRLARHAREITGQRNLCMAGGVALNCVANGKILRENIFDAIWLQPAAGDAGGAVGAALAVWHSSKNQAPGRESGGATSSTDKMKGALLGPEFSDLEIEETLTQHKAVFERLDDDELFDRTAGLLAQEKVIGWVQGRMEFGPRALGNRSILGDPRSARIQSIMNLKVKFRESFRPFAPAVLCDRASEYFDLNEESPYMLFVAPVKQSLMLPVDESVTGLDRLKQPHSTIPAVTHVDGSARIQTVHRETNPRFHALLERFAKETGCPMLVNTSFNVRGEPIVCSPDDAYRCFFNTEMDYLVIGNFLLERGEQPHKRVARTFEPVLD